MSEQSNIDQSVISPQEEEVDKVQHVHISPQALLTSVLENGGVEVFPGYNDDGTDDWDYPFIKVNSKIILDILGPLIDLSPREDIISPNDREGRYKKTLEIDYRHIDWEKEANRALLNTIQALYRSGVFTKKILDDAVKFAGPGNLRLEEIDAETDVSAYFGYGRYADYLESIHGREEASKKIRFEGLPLPENKEARNNYLDLTIYKEQAINSAEYLFEYSEHLDLSLSRGDCLFAALSLFCAHEFGHAIDNSLKANGINIKNQKNDDIRNNYFVNSEHFARGIERLVLPEVLRQRFRIDINIINRLLQIYWDEGATERNELENLMKLVSENKIPSTDILHVYWEIINCAKSDIRDTLPNESQLEIKFAYQLEPYSEEEIRNLVASKSEKI